jgi:hypothetical protein
MTNTTGEKSDVDSSSATVMSSATAASNNNKIIPPSPLTSRATPSTSAAPSTPTPEERQKRQDRKVCYLRAAVILVLISATIIVATFVGWFVKSAEYHDFELQYEDSVAKVAMAFQHRINMKHNVAKTFSAMITSRCKCKASVLTLTHRNIFHCMKDTAHLTIDLLIISYFYSYQMAMLHRQH